MEENQNPSTSAGPTPTPPEEAQPTNIEQPAIPSLQPVQQTPNLIKSHEELTEDERRETAARIKLMVFLGTIIFMIIISAYILKSGKQFQGSLGEVIVDPQHLIKFCPINQYSPLENSECTEIPQFDCDKIDIIKRDPLKYKIDSETIKQDWWIEQCDNDKLDAGTAINAEEIVIKDAIKNSEENIDLQPEAGPTSFDCGNAKARASIETDRGNVNRAYDLQKSQLLSIQCHPEYTSCQQTLASAVAAKAYLDFAINNRREQSYMIREIDRLENAFYGNAECIDVTALCTEYSTNGISASNEAESLPLSLLTPTSDGTESAMEPGAGVSSFSQEALESNIENAIKNNNLYDEKEFFRKYCVSGSAVTPAPEQNIQPSGEPIVAPTKVKRTN